MSLLLYIYGELFVLYHSSYTTVSYFDDLSTSGHEDTPNAKGTHEQPEVADLQELDQR